VKVIKSKEEVSQEYDQEMREKGEMKDVTAKKNIDYDGIRKKIGDDIEIWKQNNDPNSFNWDTVERVTKKHGLGTFMKCYFDAIIDAIGRKEDVDNAYLYLKTIIDYYANKLYTEERREIVNVALNCLELLNDYALDNHFLLDIWGRIMYTLETHQLFTYRDLEKLSNLDEGQIDCIVSVVCKAMIESGNDNATEELLKLSFFRANKKTLMDKYEKLTAEK